MAPPSERLGAFGRTTAASEPLAADATLPLSPTELQASLSAVYHAALQDSPRSELLRMLCIELGKRVGAPLVMLARKAGNGTIAIDAASADNALAIAFHRLPECWDGGVASQGPASSALRSKSPVRMSFSSDAVALWRAAAEQEHIADVIAVPFALADQVFALELFAVPTPRVPGAVTLDAMAVALQRLLEDLDVIERRRLVADALEQAGNAAFVTDAHGTFVWTNAAFHELSGYSADDVRGHDPRLLHSGKQGVRYYRELWSTIRSGNVWSGETIDRDKSGRLYTIRQTVSPLLHDGRVTHYVSIHENIGAQKRRQETLELATGVDQRTGLLTRAAFEAAARDALSTAAARQNGAELLLISLRGLRKASASFDAEIAEFLADAMGRRVREALPSPHLAAAVAPYEYAALIQDDQLGGESIAHLVDALQERLDEPVLYLGGSIEAGARCVRASYPAAGGSFEELWASADRQLADEPLARLRRREARE